MTKTVVDNIIDNIISFSRARWANRHIPTPTARVMECQTSDMYLGHPDSRLWLRNVTRRWLTPASLFLPFKKAWWDACLQLPCVEPWHKHWLCHKHPRSEFGFPALWAHEAPLGNTHWNYHHILYHNHFLWKLPLTLLIYGITILSQ